MITTDDASEFCRGPLVVQIVDVAAQARAVYGDAADFIAGRTLPAHDYRFRLATPAGLVTFGTAATAADIATRMDWEQLGPGLTTLLAAVDNALRNGSYMTGANLAFGLLCERLGVDRDGLQFDPLWARPATEDGR
jgi:hypothetical protein